MPKSFKIYGAGERPMDLWLPLPMVAEALTNRSPLQGDLHLLARLKKGVTLQQAQAEAQWWIVSLRGNFLKPTEIFLFVCLIGGGQSLNKLVRHSPYCPAP